MRAAMLRLGEEHRNARVAAGLSLRDAAAASGSSRSQLWRFERGEIDRALMTDLGAWFSVLGLDLVLKAYPAGDPVRDRAQLDLLERLRARLHPSLRWRTEVPLPIEGDLRAWDAEIRGRQPASWLARVEAETRIADGQALERRLTLKLRDDPQGHLILLLSDTRSNRVTIRLLRDGLSELLPLDTRQIMTALATGRDPGGSGIVIL
jgi:transcriptional regulator with XRE-family HTH domain